MSSDNEDDPTTQLLKDDSLISDDNILDQEIELKNDSSDEDEDEIPNVILLKLNEDNLNISVTDEFPPQNKNMKYMIVESSTDIRIIAHHFIQMLRGNIPSDSESSQSESSENESSESSENESSESIQILGTDTHIDCEHTNGDVDENIFYCDDCGHTSNENIEKNDNKL